MPCYGFAFMSELKKEKDKVRNKKEGTHHWFYLMRYILPPLPNQYFDFWIDLDRIQNMDLFISKSK